jgi:methylmalonyl-CoA mutase N-terminal domain/subunit
VSDSVERDQNHRLKELRARRDAAAVAKVLEAVRDAARGNDNLMPRFIDAVDAGATLGEVCNVLREVFGVYRAPEAIA